MKTLGYIFATIIAMTYSALIGGWTFAKLWEWFIVTTFGLDPLSISAAIGLAMTVSFVATSIPSLDDDDKDYIERLLYQLILNTVRAALVLIMGWVVVGFI